MSEIDNRFELIRIAVGLADHEVIESQIRRLRNFSTDVALHAILDELERKNFRQALYMMKEYVQNPIDDFFAAPETAEVAAPAAADSGHAASQTTGEGLFDLDLSTAEEEEEQIIGLDDMLKMTRESTAAPRDYVSDDVQESVIPPAAKPEETAEDDPLFSLDRTERDDTELPDPTFEAAPEKADSQWLPKNEEADETTDETGQPGTPVSEELFAFSDEEEALSDADEIPDETEEEPSAPSVQPDTAPFAYEMEVQDVMPEQESSVPVAETERMDAGMEKPGQTAYATTGFVIPEEMEGEQYTAFAYMGQKYRNMLHQYPQVEKREEGIVEDVQRFIDWVSVHDYSDAQVEAAITRYQEFKDQGDRAAAAQMLIAAATTESKFAQFMLARELFKGEILRQNYPEAFTQINHLAEEDFPEAICDLGQLYEYGIGIDKNRRHALLLYEEAAEMGVERARRHYERLRSANPIKALSSLLKRRR